MIPILLLPQALMRRFAIAACSLLLVLGTGCATHYEISTYMGQTIRAASKPQLNAQGFYVFTDSEGQEMMINRIRVRKIEPVKPGETRGFSFD